jgi:hypothetical protein
VLRLPVTGGIAIWLTKELIPLEMLESAARLRQVKKKK